MPQNQNDKSMKTKILNVIAFLFFMATGSMAETVYCYVEPTIKNVPQYPKAPARPLTIDITGHTLSLFSAFEDVVTVTLLDEDENVVYTDRLALGQTTLVFPDTHTGEYTIRLSIGSLCYVGVIELRN